MEALIGKTIQSIEKPDQLLIKGYPKFDDNYIITFTDGTILLLASWDYEGYSSGIETQIIYVK